MKALFEKIEENFMKEADKKNSWGKNELKLVLKEALNKTLLEVMEEGMSVRLEKNNR